MNRYTELYEEVKLICIMFKAFRNVEGLDRTVVDAVYLDITDNTVNVKGAISPTGEGALYTVLKHLGAQDTPRSVSTASFTEIRSSYFADQIRKLKRNRAAFDTYDVP